MIDEHTRFDLNIIEEDSLSDNRPQRRPTDKNEHNINEMRNTNHSKLFVSEKHIQGLLLFIGLVGSLAFFAFALWKRESLTQLPQNMSIPVGVLLNASNLPSLPSQFQKSPQTMTSKIHQKSSSIQGKVIQSQQKSKDIQSQKLVNPTTVPNPSLMLQYRTMQFSFKSKFSVPKIIWLYSSGSHQTTYLQQLNAQNIIHFAKVTNHQIRIVTRQTYKQYFMYQNVLEIENCIQKVEKRQQAFYLKKENEEYIKTVIALALLQEYGGIYIDDTLTLTEPLDWLESIDKEMYVNLVDKQMHTQIFGFHDVIGSGIFQKPTFQGIKTDRYTREIPGLQSFFIATYPHTEFIKAASKQFKRLLYLTSEKALHFAHTLQNERRQHIYRRDSEIRGKLFTLAAYSVLFSKQAELRSQEQTSGLYAIDYYGVRSINRFYFPHKLDFMLDKRTIDNTYYHLARVSLQELQAITGPLRYMIALTPLKQMNELLNKGKEGDHLRYIYKHSFLEQFLLLNSSQPWVIDQEMIISSKLEKTPWQSLPKKVWVFWGNGIENSSATHQLCTRNIKDMSNASGFSYHEVTRSNLHEYLDNSTIDRILTTLKNSKHRTYEQTFSDFVRLALLIKHGGVYMDASFILLQNLNWLVNLPFYPQQFIYNRYGAHPKVFVFFNPQYATNIYQTQIDQEHQTKSYWHLAYQNNFIAAQANNELIVQWFEEFITYHTLQHSQIKQRFKECKLGQQTWSTQRWSYLYEMDAIKCVIGRRNNQLIKEGKNKDKDQNPASKYYQIWSMNGYNGVQKMRGFTNFENPETEDNFFASFFSQKYIEKVIGSPREVVKFFGYGSKEMSRVMYNKMKDIEPDSLCGKYLLKYKSQDEVIKVLKDDPVLLKL